MKRLFVFGAAAAMAMSMAGCHQERVGGFRAACGADIDQFCANVDRSEVRDCMRQHADQLSASCKAFIAARRARMGSGLAPAPSGAPAAGSAAASSAQ